MDIPWIKLVIAISLDGRISFTPSSKNNLGGSGDRRILEESLAWADASLMGGSTLRMHKNTCLINNQKIQKKRQLEGKNAQPTCIVVSHKGDFDNNFPFFSQPINRWLITDSEKLIDKKNIKGFDRKINLKDNWLETLKNIKKNGISKIILLGGAKLTESLLKEDKINELQLTITPKILGGKNCWTPYGINNLPMGMYNYDSWIFKEILNLGNNEIMVRYFRNRK